jgi:hypothetical protein
LKLREPFTFVTDRCLGKYDVPDAIRSALRDGEKIERLDDHYAPNAEDAKWIPDVGAKGWIILTKDSALRRNPLEVRAMLSARTGVFIFGNASVTSKQLANGLMLALPRVRTAVRRFAVPVIGRINLAGGVDVLWAEGTKLERPKRVK